MVRGVWAFVAAPFPAALVQSIVVALWPKEGMGVFANPPSMFVAICLYFYFFGLLIGVPALLIMRGGKSPGMRAYVMAGMIVGLLPVCAALGWTAIQGDVSTYAVAYNLLLFGLGGLAAGSLYWLIGRRGRARTSP